MKQTFTAEIKQAGEINGAYIEPPFDVEEVFGAKRVKVLATFDGVEYRGSIVRMGGCYMLGLTKEIRNLISKDFGDTVNVTIEKDVEDRIIELPTDFSEAIDNNPEAKKTFEKLSYTGKKDYIKWITDAKKVETRLNRIEKSLEFLAEGKKLK
ncbi:MAG: YdeI/OmpD-associated family protein [Herbinix sp.]|nr:YdeI/OmpD-associated family protein [Herbinix sp.]